MVIEIWEIGWSVNHAKFGNGTVTELDRTCYQPSHSEDDPWVTISYTDYKNDPASTTGVQSTLMKSGWHRL